MKRMAFSYLHKYIPNVFYYEKEGNTERDVWCKYYYIAV